MHRKRPQEEAEGAQGSDDDRRPAREPVPAYQRALGLLVRREHSAGELKRKLRGKGVEADELDVALETLQRQGFQDDRRYAEALVRSRALAGQGPVRIRAELRMNGVPTADVDAAFEAAEAGGVDWLGVASRVAARFLPALRGARGPEGLKQRHRAMGFLLRRGFPQDIAREALSAGAGALDDDGSGDD
ncbi:MAG: regulatory protein RecX [Silanimonas sp.]